MLAYYLSLAVRSLRRNPALTALIIMAIGVGIGASMTTLTVYRAMAGDPIAHKASQLFAPQIDAWGPGASHLYPTSDHLPDLLTYTDMMGLMQGHAAARKTGLYRTHLAVRPPNPQILPFRVGARAAFADFFPMFDVPFEYGAPWTAADDRNHASVVVLSQVLNERLFGGADSVGKTVHLEGQAFRVIGILKRWDPVPRFYDLEDKFGGTPDDAFLPLTRALDMHALSDENTSCANVYPPGWNSFLHSDCVWFGFWVQLPTPAAVSRYRTFLRGYAAEQQHIGRFQWPPRMQLRDVHQWLVYHHVVSDEARILILVSFSFLIVCLLNAMGLMLARITQRSRDISLRCALGADRAAVFSQSLIEAGVIGLSGAILGLFLTAAGLAGLRSLLAKEILVLSRLDWADIGITVGVALVAALLAGLYPAWRASRFAPAGHLRG